MRKFILLTLVLSNANFFSFSQTTLPTSWDFATTPASLPTGWSTNTTASYSSGLQDQTGGTSRAGKMQATGHHFTINFFDEPGSISYNLRAYSSNSANFQGTLLVEESENGTTWSTLRIFSNNDFGNSWDFFTDTPDADSRYIRFNLSNKVSGINAGIDDVTISEVVPLNAEINVVFENSNVPNNTGIQFASPVSTATMLKLGVENLGSQGTLYLSSTSITGSAAGDFSVTTLPDSVTPLGADTLVISFNPTIAGSRLATLSIENNDSNEDPYVVSLEGIGGTGATEPEDNPSSLTTNVNKTYRVKSSFNTVNAEGYLVLFKRNNSINATVDDGVEYEKGQGVGNAKVAYIGGNSTFWLKEATANDTFYVEVYAYNGSGSFINYKNDDPLSETIITASATFRTNNYYNGVDPLQNTFIEDLHDVVNPHMVRFYSNYAPDMIPRFVARDTTNNQQVVTGVYSNDKVVFDPPFGWPETGMNREHTLPSSWMPTSGNTGTPEYQDFHHLFPTIATANGQRGNAPLGEVINVSSSYGDGKRGTDSFGNTVYEPRASQKGDAARAIFYMQTTYHNPQAGNSWALNDLQSNGPNQRLDVLLQWHISDLPCGYEQARNDYLDSLQQNRNPFVDSAYRACYINFKTMEYIAEPDSECLAQTVGMISPPNDTSDTSTGTSSINNNHDNFIFYPNPAKDFVIVGFEDNKWADVTVYDITGKVVLQQSIQGISTLPLYGIRKGIYLARFTTRDTQHSQTIRLVIEP
ncbi:MAG: endonuclease [Salibacteraceae bacterium]